MGGRIRRIWHVRSDRYVSVSLYLSLTKVRKRSDEIHILTDSESLTNRFTSFLARHAYPSLSFASAPSSSRPKKLLLLDDLPNLSHSPTRAAFQQALLEFVGGWTGTGAPLVVVLSETGDSGRAGESWKERRGEGDWDLRGLLGREVLDGPSTRVIEFVPFTNEGFFIFFLSFFLKPLLDSPP